MIKVGREKLNCLFELSQYSLELQCYVISFTSPQQAALVDRIIDQVGRKALNKFLLLFQHHCQTPQCAVPVWSFANAAFLDASKGELLKNM